jgi:hypothetical protein
MIKYLIVALLTLGTTAALAGGGDYFSGPGRSPSYGPKAIAAGFGPGATSSGSQKQTGGGTQTASNSPNNCGCQDSGHH